MAKKAITKKNEWVKHEAFEMRGAIELYKKLAQDSFERQDYDELGSQSRALLDILGEKNMFPEDLEKNGCYMQDFIFSLANLAEENFEIEGHLKLNYYASMYCSSKVENEIDFFCDDVK